MSNGALPAAAEPRFFFLMPVWGARYIEYLLTFGLPTLLAPNNLPWLPNRAVSQFTFITTVEDEKQIRASKLFAKLEALMPVKFICLDFYLSGDRQEKFDQLGNGLKRGAHEALGRGFCMFCQPDSIYSDGILKFLYGVVRSGKKACVSHGPSATLEGIVPHLRARNQLTFDEVNPLPSRVLARALMDNLHPDEAVHCMGHPHYPLDPYMGFWLSPKLDGALYRFVSLHPFLVDLSHLTEIVDFGAIDHNFIRSHAFTWSDVHVETDSDNFLVVNAKPEKERNVVPNPNITHSPITCLTQALYKPSNDDYSRFCFFHGLKVHTGDLDRDWHNFETANLRWLSTSTNAVLATTIRNASLAVTSPSKPSDTQAYKHYWRHFVSTHEKLFRHFAERGPLAALKYSLNVLRKLTNMILGPMFRASETSPQVPGLQPAESPPIATEFCAVCRPDARRCVSRDESAR